MSEPTIPTTEELTIPETAEFRFCRDGDLEIELTTRSYDRSWTGVFLTREQAVKLRDYLVRMLP